MNHTEARKYLSSDASDEDKKRNVMRCTTDGWTCLHNRKCNSAHDLVKSMIDIGGKELVVKTTTNWKNTAFHDACYNGASYDVIKEMVDVGGKDLVMMKNKRGNNALHHLCYNIKKHTKAAEKINLFLEVGDANVLLLKNLVERKTPLQMAAAEGASDEIKNLLTPQSNSESSNKNSNTSPNSVPVDGSNTLIKQSHQNQQTTSLSSSTNGVPSYITVTLKAQLEPQVKESIEYMKKFQEDDVENKYADHSSLQDNLQVDCRNKLLLASALAEKGKELEQSNRRNEDQEQENEQSNGKSTEVEALRAEIATLFEQNKKFQGQLDNMMQKSKASSDGRFYACNRY